MEKSLMGKGQNASTARRGGAISDQVGNLQQQTNTPVHIQAFSKFVQEEHLDNLIINLTGGFDIII